MVSLLMGGWVFAETAAPTPQAPPGKPFVHPGLLHSSGDLAFIEDMLAKREQPWVAGLEKLQSADHSALTYQPKPRADVVRWVRAR
ncbi:MAG: hypothetical protein ACR2RV_27515, partial [Verrucomicrobiales bacterium]